MKSKNVVLIWGIVLILLLCCGCMNGGLLGASDDSSSKLHTVTIQQFTAFKPLAHRPKPMLAKP